MIDVTALSESARYLDALSEEHDSDSWPYLFNVDQESLHYVAEQRALRCAMMMDGMDPTLLSRTEKTPVQLSEEAIALMPHLTALSMDGIAIGIHAGRQNGRQDS